MGENLGATICGVCPILSGNNPKSPTVKRMVEKFENSGSVIDLKHTTCARSGRSETNVEVVRESVAESPDTSIHYYAHQPLFTASSIKIHSFMCNCNLINNFCQQTKYSKKSSLVGSVNNKKSMLIFWTKPSAATKHIFVSMVSIWCTKSAAKSFSTRWFHE